MPYIIGCDIGTTNAKSVAFDSVSGAILTSHSESYEMIHPQPDWSEQDPDEIFDAACKTIRKVGEEVLAKGELLGISFSAAMHGVLAIDGEGKRLTNLIIWADNRSSDIALKLRSTLLGKKIYNHNGTPIHAMAPVCKLLWLKDNEADIYNRAARFISVKEYIIFRLTGKFLVDYSIASATGLFNIRELKWDAYTLKKLGLTSEKLSKAVSPYHIEELPADNGVGLPAGTRLAMGASDGCLANLGSGAIREGTMAVTVGTSAAVRISSDKAFTDPSMQTFCYVLDESTYIVGGPSNNGAVIFEWLVDTFFKNDDFDAALTAAATVPPGCEGLLFYPYLLGERAPLWSSTVRGGFYGIDVRHTRAHFARAVMEGILLNLYSIGKILPDLDGIDTIFANGGFARSTIWVQMLADIFGIKVKLNETVETGAVGAAMIGLKAFGVTKNFSELGSFTTVGQEFQPDEKAHAVYDQLSQRFHKGAQLMLAHAV